MRSPRFGPACSGVAHSQWPAPALHPRPVPYSRPGPSGCHTIVSEWRCGRWIVALLHDVGDACPTGDRRPSRSTRTHEAANLSSIATTNHVTVVPARTARGWHALPNHHQHTPETRQEAPPTFLLRGTHSIGSTTRHSELEGGLRSRSLTPRHHCKFKFRTPNAAGADSPAPATSWVYRI
jgi:hypothetical protein